MTSLQSSYRNWVVMAGQDDENEEGVDDAVIAEAYDRVNELATQLAKETEDTRKGAKAQKLSSQPVQVRERHQPNCVGTPPTHPPTHRPTRPRPFILSRRCSTS